MQGSVVLIFFMLQGQSQDKHADRSKINGIQQETGAPVVSASTMGEVIVTSGDGTVRLFQPDRDPLAFNIHKGVILSMARESQYLLTGVRTDGSCVSL